VERVGGAPAPRGRIDEPIDEFQLLDDRARPPVIDNDRQRVVSLRAHVNEVNVQAVDLGDEVR
jgi:hypothetical protein